MNRLFDCSSCFPSLFSRGERPAATTVTTSAAASTPTSAPRTSSSSTTATTTASSAIASTSAATSSGAAPTTPMAATIAIAVATTTTPASVSASSLVPTVAIVATIATTTPIARQTLLQRAIQEGEDELKKLPALERLYKFVCSHDHETRESLVERIASIADTSMVHEARNAVGAFNCHQCSRSHDTTHGLDEHEYSDASESSLQFDIAEACRGCKYCCYTTSKLMDSKGDTVASNRFFALSALLGCCDAIRELIVSHIKFKQDGIARQVYSLLDQDYHKYHTCKMEVEWTMAILHLLTSCETTATSMRFKCERMDERNSVLGARHFFTSVKHYDSAHRHSLNFNLLYQDVFAQLTDLDAIEYMIGGFCMAQKLDPPVCRNKSKLLTTNERITRVVLSWCKRLDVGRMLQLGADVALLLVMRPEESSKINSWYRGFQNLKRDLLVVLEDVLESSQIASLTCSYFAWFDSVSLDN